MSFKNKIAVVLLLSFCLISISKIALGQHLYIQTDNKPLNKILIELRDEFGMLISFDDDLLSTYFISMDHKFATLYAAVEKLISDLPLNVEKIRNVIVIYPKINTDNTKHKQTKYLFSGRICENSTQTPLAYAVINNGTNHFVADDQGRFSYISFSPSPQNIQVHYLGYVALDTLLIPGSNNNIQMSSHSIDLKEVSVISNSNFIPKTSVGNQAGEININPAIVGDLPGYGDNTILNYLRLMPGFQTSVESNEQLLIRGSYPGQNLLTFDGIKLFNSWNFIRHIGIINPLVIKDIKLNKSGFDVSQGEGTASLLNISGIRGNQSAASYTLSMNTTTVNALLEQPISKRSVLLLGVRRTYYNNLKSYAESYTQGDMGYMDETLAYTQVNPVSEVTTIGRLIRPEYRFSDVFMKYSGYTKENTSYYISMFYSTDNLNTETEDSFDQKLFLVKSGAETHNYGVSAYYGKTLNSGLRFNTQLSFSGAETTSFTNFRTITRDTSFYYGNEIKNRIQEFSFRTKGIYALRPNNVLHFGGSLVCSESRFNNQHSFGDMQDYSDRLNLTFFVQDLNEFSNHLMIKTGLRGDFHVNSSKFILEPRISITYNFGNSWKLTAKSGLYHQYSVRIPAYDDYENVNSYWKFADHKSLQPIKSFQNTIGLLCEKKRLTISTEFFYSKSSNIARNQSFFFNEFNSMFLDVRTYGMDVFVKYENRNFEGWITYSLIKTEESDLHINNYFPSPYERRHEIKLAGVYNLSEFVLSTTYIYGFNAPVDDSMISYLFISHAYNRLDLSATYNFTKGMIKGKLGLSLLNVFDTKNIRFNQYIKNQTSSSDYDYLNYSYQSLPRTLEVFLKINF